MANLKKILKFFKGKRTEKVESFQEDAIKKEDETKLHQEIKEEHKEKNNEVKKSNYHKGLDFYESRDFSKAIEYFEKSIQEKDENYIKSMFIVGKIHVAKGDSKQGNLKEEEYKKAEKQFKQCVEENNEDLQAILELGKLYLNQRRYKDSYRELKKYIRIDKDKTSKGRIWLSKLLVEEGRYKEAEIELKAGIKSERESKYARIELAYLYIKEKRYREAEKQFQECIKMQPGDRRTIEALNKLYRIRDRENNEEISKLFDKKQTNKKLQYLREMKIREKIYLQTITEEDIKEIRKMIEKNREQKENYLVLIAIYERMGQKQNALNVIKQIQQNGLEIKGLNEIKERISSNKPRIYDITKWDNLIGWDVEQIEYKEQQRKPEINEQKEQKQSINSDKKETKLNNDEKLYKKQEVKPKYIIQEGIKQQRNNTKQGSHKIKESKKEDKQKEKKKIKDVMSISIKDVVDEIGRTYYVKMHIYNNGTENSSTEIERRQKYIKKYDKLQSILECSEENKRAKMELMLVLMNEGYSDTIQSEFPKEHKFITGLVEEYKNKEKTAKEVRTNLDEYCL